VRMCGVSVTPQRKARTRNRRGEGGLLREEIVAAAERILEREGTEEAITLRAVAREAGIAAPSIYGHFDDVNAVIGAVLDAGFARLAMRIKAATDGRDDDPIALLLAGCRAYVTFAMAEPARYLVLFGRGRAPNRPEPSEPPEPAGRPAEHQLDAFQILVDGIAACVAAGRSASTDPFRDAVMVWTHMHGLVSLRQFAPGFPWPPLDDLLTDTVLQGAKIKPASP
jgi:AcrR family transcriptional regulator